MTSGAGFMMDAMNTIKRNRALKSKRGFHNGVGLKMKFGKTKDAFLRTKEEEILFQKRMKSAKIRGWKKEVFMYLISIVITFGLCYVLSLFFL